MSIAVSAVLKPSRLLRLLITSYAACCLAAAFLLAGPQAARFHLPGVSAALCLLAAWRSVRGKHPTASRIDISGPGAIRLLVQHGMAGAPVLHTLAACTVWPALLVLVLRNAEQGGLTVVLVLRDSVAPAQFRQLAVAIRTIALRDE
ncbi:protein YgfX [Massilia sp. CF038]|uniref:protein YgfX n=1 Tax=Massilia sp. CF038 TaxID=1881045 RepID=UPI00091D4ABB|nr:protein YgfX [Massilia sp. CF038]SHG60451.1 hypothetical protein SAMN05428948_1241 [Massilia sp. CF038]